MKMTEATYRRVEAAMLAVDGGVERARAEREEYRRHGNTDERFRWDWWWTARRALPADERTDLGRAMSHAELLNDEHIDTALRKIVRINLDGEDR